MAIPPPVVAPPVRPGPWASGGGIINGFGPWGPARWPEGTLPPPGPCLLWPPSPAAGQRRRRPWVSTLPDWWGQPAPGPQTGAWLGPPGPPSPAAKGIAWRLVRGSLIPKGRGAGRFRWTPLSEAARALIWNL